jgi:hypothetical protein
MLNFFENSALPFFVVLLFSGSGAGDWGKFSVDVSVESSGLPFPFATGVIGGWMTGVLEK